MIINIQAFQYANVFALMWFEIQDYFYSNYIQQKEVLSLQILFSD